MWATTAVGQSQIYSVWEKLKYHNMDHLPKEASFVAKMRKPLSGDIGASKDVPI